MGIDEADLFVLLHAKHNLGAFFAPQKTGLCGGSAACAALQKQIRRICDPLRGCGVRRAATACTQHPQGVSITMIDTGAADFNLMSFFEEQY
jgi:hypothetical protein